MSDRNDEKEPTREDLEQAKTELRESFDGFMKSFGEARSSKLSIISRAFWCALALTFTWAKLTGMVTWSWWIVLSPVLWPLYVVGAFAAAAGVAGTAWLITKGIFAVAGKLKGGRK